VLKRLPVDEAARRVFEVAGPFIPSEGLRALLSHQVGALVVREFYDKTAREEILKDIEQVLRSKGNDSESDQVSNWKVSQSDGKLVDSEVDTIGLPLNVAKGLGKQEEYFASALKSTRRFRGAARLSPIDKLRLELDEIHPYGCVVGRDETTRRMHAAGLIRSMKRSSSRGLVHLDDVSEFSSAMGVFSANIYLQTSLAGGELEIWPVTLRSKEQMMEHALELGLMTASSAEPEAQRALREFVLPGPPVLIVPKPGDLVMLCVQRPHAVRGPIHGPRTRLSAQSFVLHEGDGMPLKVEV